MMSLESNHYSQKFSYIPKLMLISLKRSFTPTLSRKYKYRHKKIVDLQFLNWANSDVFYSYCKL